MTLGLYFSFELESLPILAALFLLGCLTVCSYIFFIFSMKAWLFMHIYKKQLWTFGCHLRIFLKRRQTFLLIVRTQCTRELYNELNKEVQTSERRRIIGIRRCTWTSQLDWHPISTKTSYPIKTSLLQQWEKYPTYYNESRIQPIQQN